ncbi:hypothetical protein LJB83_00780 [Clostridia bacterium OttesenSCG-928-F22]|nr:hypothetical protein [Clostridia bacterium OttesenSCG-928-F22]
MISNTVVAVFLLSIVLITIFITHNIRQNKVQLIYRLYYLAAALLIVWMLALIIMKFIPAQNVTLLYVMDAITNISASFSPPITMLIAFSFIHNWEKLPKKYYLFFIVPAITTLVVWTNPLHGLMYENFSVLRSEVKFGPYMFVNGLYSYICMGTAIFIMLRFGIKSHNKLLLRQSILIAIGNFVPVVISLVATFNLMELSIAATPLGFMAPIVFHGFAIYRLHFLDIKPIATQRILDWMSDCYLVLSEKRLVVTYNRPFYEVFGEDAGIEENIFLKDRLKAEDVDNKTWIYNLMTSIDSSRRTGSLISYEEAITVEREGRFIKKYYMTEITPLKINDKTSGYLAIFKDVTKVKESMQRLQNNQARMMEQERLASLGQMVGGLAHNLKTPIMSISGGVSSIERLLEECVESLDDTEVTRADYEEIYSEAGDWVQRIREACAYMSDIISAIKGQAANMNYSDDTEFSMDEVLKRVFLLMRHELISSNCSLVQEVTIEEEVFINGDINSLVQVINNLITNAIYAQAAKDEKQIILQAKSNEETLTISIIDNGDGVPPWIQKRLFKEMVTSKGAHGTGLGIYLSNALIRGKFDGEMWYRDNPKGGSIFGIDIPKENVSFVERRQIGVK